MLDLQILILFSGACLILAMIPGPDNLFVSAQSLANGRNAGLAAAFGIIFGSIVWTVAATLGLTALLATLPAVFIGIQILGAGYLVFLAYDLWRAAERPATASVGTIHAFRRGLITNLLNPKVGLYYLAFLPQFIEAARGPVWMQMLVLGALFNVVGGLVMVSLALIAGSLQARIAEKPDQGKWLTRLGALILLAIAGKLIWGLVS
ncbi:MAG: hypothetical protein COA47_12295 [Robiginitomaculum sp.]|nr:MAG: hypothetical protein COA47_12295 [Robiginitomaculum sp.]